MNSLNMRPTFYRARGSSDILSGWQARTTGDVFTSKGVEFELVAGARPALLKGERVQFNRPVDLYPTDFIEQGESGIVSHVDGDTGTVSVWLEGFHNGLGDNTLMLTPHADEEALAAVGIFTDPMRLPRAMRNPVHWISFALALSTLLVTAPVATLLHYHVAEEQPFMVFAAAVAWVSVVFGHRSALALALVTPLVNNLVSVAPEWTFTPLTPWEYAGMAFYVATALGFPWMLEGGLRLRDKLRARAGTKHA
jgi:Domain of unknown function (DUF4118)